MYCGCFGCIWMFLKGVHISMHSWCDTINPPYAFYAYTNHNNLKSVFVTQGEEILQIVQFLIFQLFKTHIKIADLAQEKCKNKAVMNTSRTDDNDSGVKPRRKENDDKGHYELYGVKLAGYE